MHFLKVLPHSRHAQQLEGRLAATPLIQEPVFMQATVLFGKKKQHQVLQRQWQTSYELLSPPAEDDRILLLLLVFSRGEVTGCPLHQYRHCQERQLPSSALRHSTAPSCLPRAPKTHCQLIAGYSTSSRKASPPLNAELQLTKGSSHRFLQCELKLGTHIHH